ncbi:MAG: hypothetical protein ACKOOL_11965 [Novosphingobium sp.]
MDFTDTYLWKKAFVEPRSDSTEKEQRWFQERFLAFRDKADMLTKLIIRDMEWMTIHDVTHLDALWETASIITNNSIELNPAEAFVLGGSILLHDSAMSLAAYQNDINQLKEQQAFKDFFALEVEKIHRHRKKN